jgi:ribosome-binding protein aMBF1 (putative translation factor)
MKKLTIKDAIPFEDVVAEWMKDPKFVKEWKKIEPEYKLASQIIGARLKQKMTQTELADKVGTGQAVISRLEGGNASPSIALLKRVSAALNTPLTVTVGV